MNINKILNNEQGKILQDFLLQTDGSTTKAIESVVKQTVALEVFHQTLVSKDQLLAEAAASFSEEGPFLKRTSSLKLNSRILSYNLVFADLGRLPEQVVKGLEVAEIPIGKIITSMESRREILFTGIGQVEKFIDSTKKVSFAADSYPLKQYRIISNGHPLFHISELFIIDTILSARETGTID